MIQKQTRHRFLSPKSFQSSELEVVPTRVQVTIFERVVSSSVRRGKVNHIGRVQSEEEGPESMIWIIWVPESSMMIPVCVAVRTRRQAHHWISISGLYRGKVEPTWVPGYSGTEIQSFGGPELVSVTTTLLRCYTEKTTIEGCGCVPVKLLFTKNQQLLIVSYLLLSSSVGFPTPCRMH